MSIEDRLTSGITRAVDRAPLGPGDVTAATTRGRRLRRRRRAVAVGGSGAVVAAIVLATTLVAGDTSGPDAPDPVEPAPAPRLAPGSWARAEASPLSARYGPLMLAVDDLVLVMGGHSTAPCPPGADCVEPDDALDDAAVYDVGTDRWSPVSTPPLAFDQLTGAVVADDVVVLGTRGNWFTYDPGTDTWSTLPAPDVGSAGPVAAADGLVYAQDDATGRDVLVLDVAARTWSSLPTDTLQPALTDTTVLATDAGVVLSGVNYDEAAPDEPTLTQADLWDGRSWTRLPRTGQIGPLTHWTGSRIVGLEIGAADGGRVNGWDRAYPFGGSLDPATGHWAPVPGLPDDYTSITGDEWVVEAADGPLVATGGRVYDDRTQTWVDLGRPDATADTADTELTGAWADGRLVVFGGYDEDDPARGDAGLSAETWVWTPGGHEATSQAPDPDPDPGRDPASTPSLPGDPAVWTLPSGAPVDATTTSLTLDVSRLGCNSGVTGTVVAAVVDVRDTEVVVTVLVEADPDGGDCLSNRPVPYELELTEPLGARTLVDGACRPGGGAATTSFCTPDGVRYQPDGS